MFRNLKSVIYKVKDIEKATEWYNELLGTGPVLNTSVFVVYLIGDDGLGLIPRTEATLRSDGSLAGKVTGNFCLAQAACYIRQKWSKQSK